MTRKNEKNCKNVLPILVEFTSGNKKKYKQKIRKNIKIN
jgi:hypothetical protein